MADATTAADQAATVANMQSTAQHTPPPEEKHDAVSNSLETHQSLQVLHQRLAQPQAQQPSALLQQSSTMTHPAGSGMPWTSACALSSLLAQVPGMHLQLISLFQGSPQTCTDVSLIVCS
jgi:hypothetical protein